VADAAEWRQYWEYAHERHEPDRRSVECFGGPLDGTLFLLDVAGPGPHWVVMDTGDEAHAYKYDGARLVYEMSQRHP
jgi:hypothetical protein